MCAIHSSPRPAKIGRAPDESSRRTPSSTKQKQLRHRDPAGPFAQPHLCSEPDSRQRPTLRTATRERLIVGAPTDTASPPGTPPPIVQLVGRRSTGAQRAAAARCSTCSTADPSVSSRTDGAAGWRATAFGAALPTIRHLSVPPVDGVDPSGASFRSRYRERRAPRPEQDDSKKPPRPLTGIRAHWHTDLEMRQVSPAARRVRFLRSAPVVRVASGKM
jgi:hypothetical protein